jgi:hypothetical protein
MPFIFLKFLLKSIIGNLAILRIINIEGEIQIPNKIFHAIGTQNTSENGQPAFQGDGVVVHLQLQPELGQLLLVEHYVVEVVGQLQVVFRTVLQHFDRLFSHLLHLRAHLQIAVHQHHFLYLTPEFTLVLEN